MAVEVVEKKKSRGRVDKEAFEGGRLMAIISRKDPELYQRVKGYAQATGMKMTDIAYEAFKIYDEYTQLASVDARSLLVALNLIDNLMRRVVEMMMSVNQYFTSEYFAQQVDLLSQLNQQRTQQAVAKKKASKAELIEQMKMQMMTTFMNLITQVMNKVVAGMVQPTKPVSKPAPASAGGLPEGITEGVKIVASSKQGEGKVGGGGK